MLDLPPNKTPIVRHAIIPIGTNVPSNRAPRIRLIPWAAAVVVVVAGDAVGGYGPEAGIRNPQASALFDWVLTLKQECEGAGTQILRSSRLAGEPGIARIPVTLALGTSGPVPRLGLRAGRGRVA